MEPSQQQQSIFIYSHWIALLHSVSFYLRTAIDCCGLIFLLSSNYFMLIFYVVVAGAVLNRLRAWQCIVWPVWDVPPSWLPWLSLNSAWSTKMPSSSFESKCHRLWSSIAHLCIDLSSITWLIVVTVVAFVWFFFLCFFSLANK